MIAAISGATGFIGQALTRHLRSLGHEIIPVDRRALGLDDRTFLEQFIEGADVVINLAGSPVAARWTHEVKAGILASRVETTRKLAGAISSAKSRPLFLSASAIGIYDSIHRHDEESMHLANGFLAQVCEQWEKEARQVPSEVRLVILRLGVVLGPGGGVLGKMYRPFSLGLGGRIGSGRQPVSFIHIDDLLAAVQHIIEQPGIRGVVNAVAPVPSTNAEFTDKLAKVLRQPAIMAVPAFAIRMLYGEGASVMLEGQQVVPARLEKEGFRFRYPTIQNALVAIYR